MGQLSHSTDLFVFHVENLADLVVAFLCPLLPLLLQLALLILSLQLLDLEGVDQLLTVSEVLLGLPVGLGPPHPLDEVEGVAIDLLGGLDALHLVLGLPLDLPLRLVGFLLGLLELLLKPFLAESLKLLLMLFTFLVSGSGRRFVLFHILKCIGKSRQDLSLLNFECRTHLVKFLAYLLDSFLSANLESRDSEPSPEAGSLDPDDLPAVDGPLDKSLDLGVVTLHVDRPVEQDGFLNRSQSRSFPE